MRTARHARKEFPTIRILIAGFGVPMSTHKHYGNAVQAAGEWYSSLPQTTQKTPYTVVTELTYGGKHFR